MEETARVEEEEDVMGDHRANVKIEFEFHGEVYKYDGWINWSPDNAEFDGVDGRVIEFFRESTADGMKRYNADVAEYMREQRAAEIERAERAEVERLNKKYGKATT
jgi:hypothetical protein